MCIRDSPSSTIKQKILSIIATSLLLPDSAVENYLKLHKPSVSYEDNALQLGRARMQVSVTGRKVRYFVTWKYFIEIDFIPILNAECSAISIFRADWNGNEANGETFCFNHE